MSTVIKNAIRRSINAEGRQSSGGQSLLQSLAESLTRLTLKESDFLVEYDFEAEKLTITITPETDYGEFAMQKFFNAECQEEISK